MVLGLLLLQGQLLTGTPLLPQPFLQILLPPQKIAILLVVMEGLAHQLRLGDLRMFQLIRVGKIGGETKTITLVIKEHLRKYLRWRIILNKKI